MEDKELLKLIIRDPKSSLAEGYRLGRRLMALEISEALEKVKVSK